MNYRIISLILIIFLTNCTDDAQNIPPLEPVEETTAIAPGLYGRNSTGQLVRLKAYAEPIGPDTIKAFSHLSGFIGHIVVGNRDVQIVFGGITAKAGTEGRLLRIYEKHDSRWQELETPPLLAFEVGRSKAPHLLVSVDTVADADNETARATFKFDDPNTNKSYEASVSVSSETDTFSIGLSDNLRWRFKTTTNRGRWSVPAKQNYALYFQNESVISLTTYSTRVHSLDGQSLVFSNKKDKTAFNGFSLGIGPEAGRRALLDSAASQACQTAVATDIDKPQELTQKQTLYASCMQRQQGTELSFVLPPADDDLLTKVPRRLIVLDQDNAPVAYASGYPGDSITFHLPEKAPQLKMREVFQDKVWNDALSFNFAESTNHTVQLAPRKFHHLTITAAKKAEKAAAALIHIHSLTDRNSQNPVPLVKTSSQVVMLSKSTLLAAEWPIKLGLVAGNYQIDVLRAHQGRLCSFAISAASSGQSRPLVCKSPAKNRRSKNLPAVASLDLATYVYEDYVQALHNALAIDGMASQLTDKKLLTDDKTGTEMKVIPQLSVYDTELMIGLNLFPADQKLDDSWQDFQKTTDGSTISKFASFAKKFAPNSVLELTCPRANLSTAEYLQLIDELQPTAVRLFGCDVAKTKAERDLIRGKISKGEVPLKVTSVSGLRSSWQSFHFPRIVLQQNDFLSTGQLYRSLREGDYTLSHGGILSIDNWTFDDTSRSLTLEARMQPFVDVRPTLARVYTDNGSVLTKKLNPKTVKSLRWSMKMPRQAKWFRLEILGTLPPEKGKASEKPLAMTNFISIR